MDRAPSAACRPLHGRMEPKAYAADLDGDGDYDILSASSWHDRIAWYENNGSGIFGSTQTITTGADGANSVYAADLDGDGDYDVLSASEYDDRIAWYENNGSGTFGSMQTITTGRMVPIAYMLLTWMGMGTMMFSRLPNMTIRSRGTKMTVREPLGACRLSRPRRTEPKMCTRRTWMGMGTMTFSLPLYNDDQIAWYENNGTGTFGACRL